VNGTPNQPKPRPRFTIRTVLILTLLIALLLGWHVSVRDARRQLAQQVTRLRYAEEELERTRDELDDRDRPKRGAARVLRDAELDGAHLRGVTISSPSNAFQRASFKNCDLENATLQGGGAAFQRARFDGSKLANAKLTGGVSSFQEATFVDSDLTGAVLFGGGASFQRSSFENATLVRARLVGSFQMVNISGTHFEGADLSALDGPSLASCYFRESPTYDGQTQFPATFDPVTQLWRRVAD
jgi:uncharacterized protein YjbI with pentapeptide repeats